MAATVVTLAGTVECAAVVSAAVAAIATGAVLAAAFTYGDFCGRLTPFALKTIAVSTPLILGVLVAEVTACSSLLSLARAPWHAPFDICFWQGYFTLFDVIALATPGSIWLRGDDADKTA